MKIIKIIKDILIIIVCLVFLSSLRYHKYDLNKDGKVNVRDMLRIQKYIIDNYEGDGYIWKK